jgi:hypothetical protein
MDRDRVKYGLIFILVCVVVFAIIYGLMAYQREMDVAVESRWWDFNRRIVHEVWICKTISIDPVITSCGYEDRTRCRATEIGREWPPRPPEMSCSMKQDDWYGDDITYHITYRVSETDKTGKAHIERSEWDGFTPGVRGHIVLDVMNGVREFETRLLGE